MNKLIEPITRLLNGLFEGIVNILPSDNLSITVGLGIILFSILVKVVLFPLNVKQIKSSLRMQEFQPELKKLQEKHKGNPQKLQEEQMKLYKEHNINPMAGCLPLLIQWPILIAMFTVFRSSELISENHPGFLWIKDLAAADPLYILPVLTAITSFVSMKYSMSQSSVQPGNDNPMAGSKMNIMMAVMMLVISLKLDSSVVLYYVVGNLFQMGQTFVTRKFFHASPVSSSDEAEAVVTVNENKNYKTSSKKSKKKKK